MYYLQYFIGDKGLHAFAECCVCHEIIKILNSISTLSRLGKVEDNLLVNVGLVMARWRVLDRSTWCQLLLEVPTDMLLRVRERETIYNLFLVQIRAAKIND